MSSMNCPDCGGFVATDDPMGCVGCQMRAEKERACRGCGDDDSKCIRDDCVECCYCGRELRTEPRPSLTQLCDDMEKALVKVSRCGNDFCEGVADLRSIIVKIRKAAST